MIKDNQKNKSLSWKGKWPLFLIANLAILLVIGISTARESYRSWTVDKEIANLKNQIQTLENKKIELNKLSKKIKNEEYLEKQARAKLNLQKKGERVIVLEGVDTLNNQNIVNIDKQKIKADNNIALSNPQKWWLYFSRKNKY